MSHSHTVESRLEGYQEMKALVTGGTGFIGSHLVEKLVVKGHEVRCLVRQTSNSARVKELGVELTYGDAMDKDSLSQAMKGREVVYHLVGGGAISTASKEGWKKLWQLNVGSLRNILEVASRQDITRVVYFSSIAAMGVQKNTVLDESSPCQPRIPYEQVKYESEQLARKYYLDSGVPVVIIRPPLVYGPGDTKSEVLKMARLIKRKLFPLIGGGKAVMPCVYVEDVAEGAILAAQSERAAGNTYILSDKQSYPFKQIVRTIAEEMGANLRLVYIPLWLAKAGVGAVEITSKIVKTEPFFTLYRLGSMTSHRFVSIEKARQELGYEPKFDLKQGLQKTIQWYGENGYL